MYGPELHLEAYSPAIILFVVGAKGFVSDSEITWRKI
jgi:hypothetical protein